MTRTAYIFSPGKTHSGLQQKHMAFCCQLYFHQGPGCHYLLLLNLLKLKVLKQINKKQNNYVFISETKLIELNSFYFKKQKYVGLSYMFCL